MIVIMVNPSADPDRRHLSKDAIARALAKPVCQYCNTEISVLERIHPGHCGSTPCFNTHIQAAERKRSAAREAQYQENISLCRDTVRAELMQISADHGVAYEALTMVAVPYQNAPLAPLPHNRLAAFVAHHLLSIGRECGLFLL